MSALLLTRLGAAALVFTLLAALLMLARRRLRAGLGAEAAYALWLALPLGVALCGWPVHRVLVHVNLPAAMSPDATPLAAVLSAPARSWPQAATLLLGAWLLGACAAALVLVRRQLRLQRALGPLQRIDGDAWLSASGEHGPMLVGLPRPRIVLPADFAQRYTPEEQAAILAHERMHRRRGDLWWNALAALLRCLFWFHPLAAAAQRRFLADQELACDSAVLRLGRHAPRSYANALLKTQLGARAPLACTMQAGSPLKERILNLQRGAAPRRVKVATALVLVVLGVAGARIAWAASLEVVQAQDASASHAYGVQMKLAIHGQDSAPRLIVEEGKPFAVAGEAAGKPWRAEFVLERTGEPNVVRVAGKISEGGATLTEPVLIGKLGERMGIKVGDEVQLAFVINEQKRAD